MSDPSERARFLNLAGVFEGGLVLVGLLLAWLFNLDLLPWLRWDRTPVLLGLVAALPPFALFLVIERLRIPALARIKQKVLEILGPALAACHWYDLVLVAALAGLGEELLFRGVAQPLLERWCAALGAWDYAAGLVGSNIVFGLLHLITPLYAVLAGGMGLYFGWLLDATGSRNLLGPILAHGLYDYLAFLLVAHEARRTTCDDLDEPLESPGPPDSTQSGGA